MNDDNLKRKAKGKENEKIECTAAVGCLIFLILIAFVARLEKCNSTLNDPFFFFFFLDEIIKLF